MENEDKRPIVYVSRVLTAYNGNNIEFKIGYYVSKAYLSFVGKKYCEDGTVARRYEVKFVNRFEMLDKVGEFYAEMEDSDVFRSAVFGDYVSCKKYVDVQNRKLHNLIKAFSATDVETRWASHKQALKYGEALEEKFISVEEREQTTENTNNY